MKGRVRQALTLTPDRGTFDHRLTPTAHRLTRAALSFALVVMDGGVQLRRRRAFAPHTRHRHLPTLLRAAAPHPYVCTTSPIEVWVDDEVQEVKDYERYTFAM
jgi:hypothetical protein